MVMWCVDVSGCSVEAHDVQMGNQPPCVLVRLTSGTAPGSPAGRLVADATSWSVRVRRLLPIVAMLGGALVGGALLRWVSVAAPLWLAAALLVCCAATAHAATGRPQSQTWQ
jgi:hypothetical protein